ncbi:class I SAM-dependent methyltransferase [bacterium]|nr:class I SAM-dependent methyltransferase [bacterium]
MEPERAPEGACELCGERATSSFDALDPKEPRFRVVRCSACRFGWTLPVLSDDEIGRWYPKTYYGEGNVRFNPVMERLVRIFRRRRASVIARRIAPGPALDVGCGRGLLLSNLRELGFEPHGIELSEHAAFHARSVLGIDVQVANFSDPAVVPHGGPFRVVIFWHTLEHFRVPEAAVRRARELLAPGGLLAVAVPNSESVQARSARAAWFHLDIPRHYVHFGTRSLTRLLERNGFRIAQVSHFSLEQNPYGWIQSLYNWMGFEWNLLYEMLKSATARRQSLREHPIQVVLVFLLLPFFFPLSLGLTLLETLLRRGGTVEIYARKTG